MPREKDWYDVELEQQEAQRKFLAELTDEEKADRAEFIRIAKQPIQHVGDPMEEGDIMPANAIEINGCLKYDLGDSKMPPLLKWLDTYFYAALGAEGEKPDTIFAINVIIDGKSALWRRL